MSTKQTTNQRVSRFAGPVVGILILYVIVFYMPLRHTLVERQAKQLKLEELVQRRGQEHSARSSQLAAIETEERLLAGELEATKKSGAHLVTRRADRREQVFCTTSPASLLAQAVEVLSRHELECLDSSTIARSNKSQNDPLDALKPVADLLGVTPGEENGRREVRITLSGRFENLQNAVREIQAGLTGIFIVSLEMQPSDPHANRHIWILTISV